jgi:hypothetical protein
MGSAAWMLIAWVLVGAAFLLAHAVALWQGVSARSLPPAWRIAALLPPAAPVVAWKGGARVAPVLWGVALVTYVVLRVAGA